MAGSLTYRAYTSDNGTVYSVRIDESNASAVSGTSPALMPLRTANGLPSPPSTLKRRYFNAYLSTNPNVKRKFYCGLPSTYALAIANGTITAEVNTSATGGAGATGVFIITSARGERLSIPPSITASDTALDDGDAAQ